MKKIVSLFLVFVMLLPMTVLAATPNDVTVDSVQFFDASDTEIYASVSGEVYAKVILWGTAGSKAVVYAATYAQGEVTDVALQIVTCDGTVQTVTTDKVTASAGGEIKLFVWSEEMQPYTEVLVPQAPTAIPVERFAITLGSYKYLADIDPETKTIVLDLPASCSTQTTLTKGIYTESSVASVTPDITCGEGWSTNDTEAKNLNDAPTYTFTKEGEEAVTYTVQVEWSDLGRQSGFDGSTQITYGHSSNKFGDSNSYGSRQMTPWGDLQGGGAWYQKGYLADTSTGAVIEDSTYGKIHLQENIGDNTTQAYQLDKTKTGSEMYMVNTPPSTNGLRSTKYRVTADLYLDDITGGGAYLLATDHGGVAFVKNGSSYDLYYQAADGTRKPLKAGVLQEKTWHTVAIVGRGGSANGNLYETMTVYVDGLLMAGHTFATENFASVNGFNTNIGMDEAATGKLSFDNWRATDIEQSMQDAAVLWIVGDSLVQDYAATSITQGWGTYLPNYLDKARVMTNNLSVAGSVSADYLNADGKYAEKWASVTENIKPGDVLLVSLGYNETDQSAYAAYLKQFAEIALAAGAEPVFLTQPVQLNSDGTALENRRQASIDTMETVCGENDYICLDLNAKWWDLLKDKTIDEAKTYYEGTDGIADNHPTGDWLHFREKGAIQNAEFIAKLAEESDSIFKEYLKGGYIGNVTSLTLDGKYEAKIQGNRLLVSVPNEIGGAMPESAQPDIADMSFTYTAEDGSLTRTDATHFLFTGVGGKTKTYTLVPEYYTALIDMDFDDVTLASDGSFLNSPATNALGVANGGAAATWQPITGGGEATVENGVYKMKKTSTDKPLGVQIRNIEYPSETEKLSVAFQLKVDDLKSSGDFIRIQVGENVPYLRLSNRSCASGTYTLHYGVSTDDVSYTWDNAPVLQTGVTYDFTMDFVKAENHVTMTVKVDGTAVSVSEPHEVYQQMAVFPQFLLRGYNAGLYTAYLDKVQVGYMENSLKEQNAVFLVGDSICYTYPITRNYNGKNIQGWGKTLQQRIDSEQFRVINSAREGQATGIFLNGGLRGLQGTNKDHRFDLAESWSFINKRLSSGDYVMIGLAWNESGYGNLAQYKENLLTMIRDIKAKGAAPILVTPTVGCNMTTYEISNSKESWATAMKEVAEAEDVICLDLNAKIYEIMTAATEKERESYYTDGTHYTPAGAKLVGDTICDLLAASTSPLKNALLKEEVLTDTASNLVTFEDYTAGTNAEKLSDSRFAISRKTTAAKAGDITIANDPAADGTRGKVMKIVTYAGKDNNDTVAFQMPTGSGKSTITAKADLYIESMTTTAYGDYQYTFNVTMPKINSLPIGIRKDDTKASWQVRANTSDNVPASTICEDALETGKWYTLKIVYHTETGLADYYVDEELRLGNDRNYLNSHNTGTPIPTSTGGIHFVALNSGEGTYYIDNVTLTAE